MSSFDFKIITNVLYNIVWSGIQELDTLLGRFVQGVVVSVTMKSNQSMIGDIQIGTDMSIDELTLTTLIGSFEAGTSIIADLWYSGSMGFSNILENAISVTLRGKGSMAISLIEGVAITVAEIVADFYLISDYDPDALSTMDDSTLGAIFYDTP